MPFQSQSLIRPGRAAVGASNDYNLVQVSTETFDRFPKAISLGNISALKIFSEELRVDVGNVYEKHFIIDRLILALKIERRLYDLDNDAEIEGVSINYASRRDLTKFLQSSFVGRRPAIALLDNGNYRVLWNSSAGDQLGLQFKGDGRVNYNIRFRENETIEQDHDETSINAIPELLAARGLMRLMQHEG